jgi:hypothetical protein
MHWSDTFTYLFWLTMAVTVWGIGRFKPHDTV